MSVHDTQRYTVEMQSIYNLVILFFDILQYWQHLE
jgi:hypothetical protein